MIRWQPRNCTTGRRPSRREGWYTDPLLRHERRWFSAGMPTDLVIDGRVEGHDPIDPAQLGAAAFGSAMSAPWLPDPPAPRENPWSLGVRNVTRPGDLFPRLVRTSNLRTGRPFFWVPGQARLKTSIDRGFFVFGVVTVVVGVAMFALSPVIGLLAAIGLVAPGLVVAASAAAFYVYDVHAELPARRFQAKVRRRGTGAGNTTECPARPVIARHQ